jgi:hypothetical protein
MQRKKLTKITAIVVGLLIGIPLIVIGFLLTQGAFTRASGSAPDTVNVVQITDSSATITWSTGQETEGVVLYGTTPMQLDKPVPETSASTVHRLTLQLLKPATTYYFKIRIGDTVFDNAGEPWSFTTLADTADESEASPEADQASPEQTQQPAGPDPDDLDIQIDFEDDDSLVYVISPTSDPRQPTQGQQPQQPQQPGQPTQPQAAPTLRSSTPTPQPQPTSAPQATTTPSSPIRAGSCPNTDDCDEIKDKFGQGCSSADYVQCLWDNITPTPEPPETPTDLEATASGTKVTLSWTDTSVGETKFEIYRSTNDTTGFSQVATKLVQDDPGSGQEVSKMLNSQPTGTLYYRVYSYIDDTRSQSPSNTASVTVSE